MQAPPPPPPPNYSLGTAQYGGSGSGGVDSPIDEFALTF